MFYENTVQLVGCLGADPEIRTFQNGGKVANLRLATTRKWKTRESGDTQEETEWHSVAVTSKGLVGIVEQYIRKGSYLRIVGRLRTRKWQDQSGNDRYSTEIIVAGFDGTVGLLDRQGGASGSGGYDNNQNGGNQGGQSNNAPAHDLDDEIPF